jgi:hypothetical protein
MKLQPYEREPYEREREMLIFLEFYDEDLIHTERTRYFDYWRTFANMRAITPPYVS